MKLSTAFLLLAFLLASCASPAATVPFTPTIPRPTASVLPPTATATLLPPTLEPTATASPTPLPPPPRTRYHLDARFDDPNHHLTVAETITYTNHTPSSLGDLLLVIEPNRWPGAFTLSSLAWGDGTAIQGYRLEAQRLSIPLSQPLAPAHSLSLSLAYAIDIPAIPETTDAPVHFGYTARQTNLLAWYPYIPPYRQGWLAHDPGYFGEYQVYESADFTVDLRLENAPAGLVVAASAPAQPLEGGYHYELPAGRDFALSASSQYQVFSTTVTLEGGQSVVVTHYTFPFAAAMGDAVLDAAARSLQLYSRLFGSYPNASLSVVAADFLDGMEYDGLFFLGRGFYNTYSGQPDDYLIAITAHETAHQWWYGLVGNDQALEPWLDEGLCTYSEALFYENLYPEALSAWRARRIDFYRPQGFIGQAVYDYAGFTAYRDAVYLRGAQFFEALRQQIGDEAFFAFLKEYATQEAGRLATRQEFFEILARHTQVDLSGLLAEYFGAP